MASTLVLKHKLPLMIVGLIVLTCLIVTAVLVTGTRSMAHEDAVTKTEEMAYRYASEIDAHLEVAMDLSLIHISQGIVR